MKKFIILLLFCCFEGIIAHGQYSNLHETTIGVHYFQNVFANAPFQKFLSSNSGVSIDYLAGITNRLDGRIKLNGSFPVGVYISPNSVSRSLFFEAEVSARERLMAASRFSPFITGGPGFYWMSFSKGAYGVAGAGVEIKLGDVYFLVQADRRFVLGNDLRSHYQYSVGLAGKITERRRKKKSVVASVSPLALVFPDRDGDGIPDSEDSCPDSAGLAENCGCPLALALRVASSFQNVCIICEVDNISRHIFFETL